MNDQNRHPNPRLVTNDLLDVTGLFLFEQTDLLILGCHIDFFCLFSAPYQISFPHYVFLEMTGLIRPLFWYCFSHRAKLHNKDRSPDITVDGVVWGGSVECACPSGFSQSDECQPSRDILEIISILRYLWKIPAPYSGADNECHTVLSDVDGGRIRFTQATYTTHT